jgi:flagellar biosynthesis/type III secretory pathway M-ring protein FliF/YscJ
LKTSVDETLELPEPSDEPRIGNLSNDTPDGRQGMGMTIAQHNALQLARTDPTAVATVVRSWVNRDKAVGA